MKVLIILSCCVGVALSAAAIAPASGNHCDHEGVEIPVGKRYQPIGECVEIYCDGENGVASNAMYKSCGAASTSDPKLVVVVNPKLPYPDCCPTVKFADRLHKDDIKQ